MDGPPKAKARKAILWVLIVIVGGAIFVAVASNWDIPARNQTPATTTVPPTVQTQPSPQNNLSNDNHYTNSDGETVHSSAYSNTVPAGATAQCRDGTYSFSQHRQGTCSHHGGVEQWLY
jgi:Protein of unknown function (DUF3761)